MARKPAVTDDIDEGSGAGAENGEAPAGDGSNGDGREGAAAAPESKGDEARALEEILRVVRYLAGLAEEAKKKRPAGPSRSAFEKMVKSVNAIRETTGETRKLVEGLAWTDTEDGGAPDADELAEGLRACRGDFGRWIAGERRTRRRWVALAIAAGFPAALLLGVLVEQQFQVIPIHDPTGGWRGHVWDNYGRAVVDCVAEAMRTDAEVDCSLVVRRP